MGNHYGYIKKNKRITHDVSRTKSKGLTLVYLTTSRVVQPIGWKKKYIRKPQHMLGTFLWCCAEIAANIPAHNKFNTLGIKQGRLSRFTMSFFTCVCSKYWYLLILHEELNFLPNTARSKGELTLGNCLQCNQRTKPDRKSKPIQTQDNYPQGYLG